MFRHPLYQFLGDPHLYLNKYYLPSFGTYYTTKKYYSNENWRIKLYIKKKFYSSSMFRYPAYQFLGDPSISISAAVTSRYSSASLRGIIADIEFLSRADYLVCTFSSQVNIFFSSVNLFYSLFCMCTFFLFGVHLLCAGEYFIVCRS